LIASWKTSHKEHYRHSKSDANIFYLCPFVAFFWLRPEAAMGNPWTFFSLLE
jgi:hypothetical protein